MSREDFNAAWLRSSIAARDWMWEHRDLLIRLGRTSIRIRVFRKGDIVEFFVHEHDDDTMGWYATSVGWNDEVCRLSNGEEKRNTAVLS